MSFWLTSPAEPGSRLRLVVFVAIFCVLYAVVDGFSVVEMTVYLWGRDDVVRPELFALGYAVAYAIGGVAWVALHAHAARWLRFGSYAISLVTVTTFLGFRAINERGYGITEATLFWEEIEFIPGALAFFAGSYGPPLALAVGAIALLERSLGRKMARVRPVAIGLVPLAIAAVFYQALAKTDARIDQAPVPYRVAVLTLYALHHDVVYLGTREAPYIHPAHPPLADHIVLIVDESIRGDLLSLNGSAYQTTPYLETLERRLFNYGVASSIANLSSPSNIAIQSGLRPDQLPDTDMRSMKNPNVFTYLQAAGFDCFLIDAQHVFGRPPNFMTNADIAGLTEHIVIRERARVDAEWNADLQILPELERILSRQRTFSYILKIGAHFPYAVRFDPKTAAFTPGDLGDRYSRGHAEVASNYLNTLRWGVDEFARRLVATLERIDGNVVVIYTADHGQSLFETWNGRAVRGHGHSPNPPVQQAMVPLFLLAFGEATERALAERFHPGLRDRTSAFEIFPTLLALAGYAEEDVRRHYHHSLFDGKADRSRRVFVSGNHFGADGPLYRDTPSQSSFGLNEFPPLGE